MLKQPEISSSPLPADFSCPHDGRIDALETAMVNLTSAVTTMSNGVANLTNSIAAAQNLSQNISSVAGFFTKHGSKIISFIVGTLAAAGFGNPVVMDFIQKNL